MPHLSLSLILAFLWVVASTIVALLPMRHQYAPGVALLIAAPLLIGMIGLEHGWFAGGLALAAFISMFRNPLKYLLKRLRGERPESPK
ncbi:MAG: DUF2484 family protein [Pseudomonadota bacterium]